MSAQGEDELAAIDASIDSALHQLSHLFLRRNFLTSPLLRLPPELILKIFNHTVELDNQCNTGGSHINEDYEDYHDSDGDDPSSTRNPPSPLVLTTICHTLREIGISTPGIWSTVDLTIPSLAELFLERCNYDPHTLQKSPSNLKGREAVWSLLQDRMLTNLRFLFFEGRTSEFKDRVVPVLLRAPNLSNIHGRTEDASELQFPWYLDTPLPRLSTLRLHGFSISWALPLLRNLSQLSLNFGFSSPLSFGYTPVEMLITLLGDCPDLESLELLYIRSDQHGLPRDGPCVVVQLRRLQRLLLVIDDPFTVGHILSSIGYPESAQVDVCTLTYESDGVSGAISNVLLRGDPGVQRQPQITKTLAIQWKEGTYNVSTDKSTIRCRNTFSFPQWELPLVVSKTLEVIGKEAITSFSMAVRLLDPTCQMWETILHGCPQLERITYQRYGLAGDFEDPDPLIRVLSLPYEKGLVCPRLQHLALPRRALTRGASVTLLKHTLTERDACGRRLRWIGLSEKTAEEGDRLLLESFRDLVD